MAVGTHRVQLTKQESTAGGGSDDDIGPFNSPQPIEPQEDAIESAGHYYQDESARDYAVSHYRHNGKLRGKDVSIEVGQVFFCADGVSFALEKPITNSFGWMVNDDGDPIVVG